MAFTDTRRAAAVPIELHAIEATVPAMEGHPLEAAVNGVLSSENGWSIKEGRFQHQFAVFATDKPITATMYELRLFFLDQKPSYFLRFGVSVTSDEQPSLAGHWMPLLPEQATCNFSNGVAVSGSVIRINSNRGGTIVTLRVRPPFTGITGFRLRIRPAARGDDEDLPAAVGSGPDGGFLLTQLEAEAEPLYTSDIALGCQVYSSGVVPRDLPKKYLTDGLANTYSRPDPKLKGQDFYFFLDLGRVVSFDHLVIRGRTDASPAERLGDYGIEIVADTERSIRATQWHALIRHGQLHPAADGPDVIRASDGNGVFTGSGIRVHNVGGGDLEIAEIEVYPSLNPEVQDWTADNVYLTGGKEVSAPPISHRLGFMISSHEPGVLPMALSYRWRIPKWSDAWQTVGPDGRVELKNPPPPGTYELQAQAQHSDGVWDSSGRTIAFHIAAPWWRNPRDLAILVASVGLLAAAVWWRTAAWFMNRRLALAEQHIELHRERLRIARDMHDEIGARLTHMALLADRVGREMNGSQDAQRSSMDRLAESARSAVNALDNIVWAVNPQHDSVGSLADYLCDYAPGYLEAADIQCQLDIEVKTEQMLSLAARHGLLMAVKEALQNVVKHAEAKHVRIVFRGGNENVAISICDDGRGMGQKDDGTDRSGLENMRHRLAEIGGKCEISSPPTKGTIVHFSVPLKHHEVVTKES